MPINTADQATLAQLIHQYKEHETTDPLLTTQRLLQLTMLCIDQLIQPEDPAQFHQQNVWVALCACAFRLSQDNAMNNLAIPWTKIAMLKRVILLEDLGAYRNMSHLAEETVFISNIELGPHMALINYALADIIQHDLPTLRQAITAIQQGNPINHLGLIAQGIKRLVAYENDEYYLAKISSSAKRLIALIQPPYTIQQLTQAANHFIVLGEAINHLSAPARQPFDPNLRALLIDIRLIFCHPERHNNRVVVQRFINGHIIQPELPLSLLIPLMPQLDRVATHAIQQYQLNYQFLPSLSARTQNEIAAVGAVWRLIKVPAVVPVAVALPAYFHPAISNFRSPLTLMRERSTALNANITRLNESITTTAPEDFTLNTYDPMAELEQADTLNTQNEIDALTHELTTLEYRIQQADLYALRDTIHQILETVVTFSNLMNLIQRQSRTGHQANFFSFHAQMRFYQVQAGSYVRSLLANQRFIQQAQQHQIILDHQIVSLAHALNKFSQAPRGYLAHLGKRALGQSITVAPESAFVFYTSTQILQACLTPLRDIDTALQRDQAALTIQTA